MIRGAFYFWACVLGSLAALVVGVFSKRLADRIWDWCVETEYHEYLR